MPMQWLLSTCNLCFYRHAFGIDCSKIIGSLESFANFLFQDNCIAINVAKNNKQQRVKKLGGFGVANPKNENHN